MNPSNPAPSEIEVSFSSASLPQPPGGPLSDPLSLSARSLAQIAQHLAVLPKLLGELQQMRESIQLLADCVEIGQIHDALSAPNTLRIALGDTPSADLDQVLAPLKTRLERLEATSLQIQNQTYPQKEA